MSRILRALLAIATATAQAALAQQSAGQSDSARAEIRTTLRAFYFNLAHHDWEAMAADILSAKVLASHPAPESLLALGRGTAPAGRSGQCSTDDGSRVEHATIMLRGNWASASVPRCRPSSEPDQFRLVHFERRWRIVYIELWAEPRAVELAR
jgi:hypothetical protein